MDQCEHGVPLDERCPECGAILEMPERSPTTTNDDRYYQRWWPGDYSIQQADDI
jgi:hypothetical protein